MTGVQTCALPIFVVAGIAVKTDTEGRYCLNDFHKAAGGEAKHKPGNWLQGQQTQELVEEIGTAGIPALVTQRGGSTPGTYVCKELVYAYAMWVSPKFHLHVIRTYDLVVQEQAIRARAELELATAKLGHLQDQVGYMTLQQFRAMSGVHWPRKMNNSLGILLRSKCDKDGLEVRTFNQNGWTTNSYPVHLMEQLADDYGLEYTRNPSTGRSYYE